MIGKLGTGARSAISLPAEFMFAPLRIAIEDTEDMELFLGVLYDLYGKFHPTADAPTANEQLC
jgi:hypothetical protein